MISTIKELSHNLLGEIKGIRHHLHQHPELSFNETNTSAFIQNELRKLNIPFKAGFAGTGIVATLKGKKPGGRVIALRADMDALPIEENTQVPF
jgi:metal-dependent amidase/aminoacylase/carboxypeptidase family protein